VRFVSMKHSWSKICWHKVEVHIICMVGSPSM
jgi:hypothetical protein